VIMKQSAPLARSISMTALLLTVCLWIAIPWAGNAAQPLLVSTQGDTDEVFAFPDVGTGLPTPGASPLTLPGSTFPHGIAYASPTRALVCNISQSEVIAMDPSTNSDPSHDRRLPVVCRRHRGDIA
jgi:hypothetical protein